MTVTGGPLHGARCLDIGWRDIQKAAKSYKSDPRFNQFAKRAVSERALGKIDPSSSIHDKSKLTWKAFFVEQCKSWFGWLVGRAKVKIGVTLLLCLLIFIILSRPLFYTVLAKSLALSIRLSLRRSIGFIAMLIDALLDEAANSLEAALLVPPNHQDVNPMTAPQFPPTAPGNFHEFLVRGLLTLIGILIGHRLPRAGRFDRNAPPTRLRVV